MLSELGIIVEAEVCTCSLFAEILKWQSVVTEKEKH